MTDDEIDFDDLDLGDLENSADEGADESGDELAPDESGDDFGDLDDLGDLDLGDTAIEDDGADDDSLFDDLEEEGADESTDDAKSDKAGLVAGRWQWPILIAALVLGVLNFIVFPASEMAHNKLQRHIRLAEEEIEKENWPLAKEHLDAAFRIEQKQPPAIMQMIADVNFAIAEEIRRDPERRNHASYYDRAQGLYQALLNMRDEEDDKPLIKGDKKIYADYQIARCLFHQELHSEARIAFEKLQERFDRNNRQRLIDEKKGKVYTAIDEAWPDTTAAKYPLAEKRSEVLNYLGRSTAALERLQESILWFKRYAPHAEHGITQLKLWEKIARGYFLDGDIESAIQWYDRLAKEYTTLPEAKQALYDLGDLLRKSGRWDEARDRLRRSMESGEIDEEHNERALFLIGQTYLDEGNFAEASNQFKNNMAEEIKYHNRPIGTAGALKHAEVAYRRGRLDEAYKRYQQIVKNRKFIFDNPFVPQKKIIDILQNMGVQSFQKDDYVGAAKIYRFMLEHFNYKRDFILNKLAEAIVAQAQNGDTKHLVEAGITYQRIPAEAGASELAKDALYKAADLFYRARDWAKADKAYETILRRYPGDPQEAQASYRRGMALKMLLQLSERADDGTLMGGAEFFFTDTVNRHTNSLFAYRARYEMGLLYAQRDNWNGARNAFIKIINDDLFTPNSRVWRDSLFELGRVEHFMDQPVPAIKHLLEAIERYPEDPRVFASRSYLGYSYFRLKKYPDARAQLRHVIAAAREDELDQDLQRYATLTIADSYVREKDYAQALANYRSAFNKYQRSSDAPWINFQIARCLEHLGYSQQALTEYNKAHWLYKRSKENNYQELPEELRKQYWSDQVDWTKNSKDWFERQKQANTTFFGSL